MLTIFKLTALKDNISEIVISNAKAHSNPKQ